MLPYDRSTDTVPVPVQFDTRTDSARFNPPIPVHPYHIYTYVAAQLNTYTIKPILIPSISELYISYPSCIDQ